MKRLLALLAVLCAFAAVDCHPESTRKEDITAAIENMKFGKHCKTGVCFAFFKNNFIYSEDIVFTTVDCTPAVELLLINQCTKPCKNKCYKNASSPQPERPERME